jgi:hypothetical protein
MKRSILLSSVAAIALLTTGAMASDLPNTNETIVTETYKPPVVQAPVQHKQKIHRGDINDAPYSDYQGNGNRVIRPQYPQYPLYAYGQYPRFAYRQSAFYAAPARLPLRLVPYGGYMRYPFLQYRGLMVPHSNIHGWNGARLAPRPIAFRPYPGMCCTNTMTGMWQRNWQDWQAPVQTEDYSPLK